MHYILELSRYINIVYTGVYLVLTYNEKLFSIVFYFLSYFCWSLNCMNWVNKFHIFFSDMLKNWGKEGFGLCCFLVFKLYKFGLKIMPLILILISIWINYTFKLDMSEILDNIYNNESVLLFAFVKYTLQSLYSKLYFLYFLEDKKFCFVMKHCSKSSYTGVFILSKKAVQLILKKLP